MKIKNINIKIIQDSRGKETLEAVMFAERRGRDKSQNGAEADGGISAGASVPSGKSTGSHEAFVLEPQRALEKFAEIKDKILGKDFKDQREFDDFLIDLDGTENKSNLGGNLILSLSLAFARLMAKSEEKELYEYIELIFNFNENKKSPLPPFGKGAKQGNFPRPIFNVINGGEHAHNKLTFQEFQIIPYVDDFGMALSVGQEFYKKLGRLLEEKFGKENIVFGDEAGYSAPFESDEQAIEILYDLIRVKNYPLRIGLDIAATSFWRSAEGSEGKSPNPPFGKEAESGYYLIGDKKYSPEELTEYYPDLIERYNIVSIEDPFYEEAFGDFAELTRKLARKGIGENPSSLVTHTDVRYVASPILERGLKEGENVLVITDDLTTTNSQRLQKAIDEKSGNAILIKLNQIGTLIETLDVVKMAYENNWKAVVSHRSGETMDDFIADLAVAVGAWGIKAGAPAKPERMAKYNKLLKIYQAITE